MVAWTLVIATVIVAGGIVVVLARQGSPGKLSEEHSSTGPDQRSQLVDRPAGPDAEPMGLNEPGQPSTAPSQVPDRRPRRAVRERGDGKDIASATDEAALSSASASRDAERPVDPDAEAIEAEEDPTDRPGEDRPVPEDVNRYVPEEPVPEDQEVEG